MSSHGFQQVEAGLEQGFAANGICLRDDPNTAARLVAQPPGPEAAGRRACGPRCGGDRGREPADSHRSRLIGGLAVISMRGLKVAHFCGLPFAVQPKTSQIVQSHHRADVPYTLFNA